MKPIIGTALALGLFASYHAYADVITFDTLPTNTIVTNQFPNVTFSGAQVLTAGVNLNSQFFPPASNPNVIYNFQSDTISASFTSFTGLPTPTGPIILNQVHTVSALVTGNVSIFMDIFSGATFLGDVSTGAPNFVGAGSGVPPNMLLTFSSPFLITDVQFIEANGDHSPNAFTIDNFTFGTGAAAVPAPIVGAGLPGLVAACLGLLGLACRRRNRVA